MSAAAVSFPPVFVSTRPVETSVASEQEELQATEELRAIVRRVAASVWYHVQPDTVPDVPGADKAARALAAGIAHAAGGVREAVSRALPEALGAVREQLIGMMRSVACPSCRMGGGEHKLSCANRPRRQVVLPACGTEVDDASMLAPHDGTGAVE